MNKWKVGIHKDLTLGLSRLPLAIRAALFSLVKEMELQGPVRGNWHKYKICEGDHHRCLLGTDNREYFAVWKQHDEIHGIEVTGVVEYVS